MANRLQAALYGEVRYFIQQGLLDVSDADATVCRGRRVMGPNLFFHVAGGEGSIRHTLEHLGPAMTSWWKDLGSPELTPALTDAIVDGVSQEVDGLSVEQLDQQRDQVLLGLLALGAAMPTAAPGTKKEESK